MLSQEEKIELLTSQIDKAALKQIDKAKKDADKLLKKETKAIKQEIKAKIDKHIEFESGRIVTAYNKELSTLEDDVRREIATKREQIKQKIFQKVKSEIEEFVQKDDYKAFLQSEIAAFEKLFGNDMVVFCKKSDEVLCRNIIDELHLTFSLKIDEGIALGGLYVSNSDSSVFAYDTLDKRLELLEEKFLSIVDLSV